MIFIKFLLKGSNMSWHIEKYHPKCRDGFAVVSKDGEFIACHFTRDKAIKEIEMLYFIAGKEQDASN